MKRAVTLLLLAAALGGVIYVLLGRGGGQATLPVDGEESLVPPVRAQTTVVADAKVVPVRSAALGMPVGGIVAEVLVEEGQRVQAGEVLLRLSRARQEAAVAQARAEVQRAQARLAQLQQGALPQEIEAAAAAVDVARAQLAKVRVAGPPLDVEIAEAELRRATAQLELLRLGARPEEIRAAEAELAVARAGLLQAEAALQETELRAPFAGVVGAVAVNTGEYVAPGTAVLWLADDSGWRFETEDLTELGVVHVEIGSAATIKLDALPGVELGGRVVSIKPMGESRLGDITYKVVIEPEEHDERLRWNMTAVVTIRGE